MVKLLDREPRWLERGVQEATYIKVNTPTLNNDGLPGVYVPILSEVYQSTLPTIRSKDFVSGKSDVLKIMIQNYLTVV